MHNATINGTTYEVQAGRTTVGGTTYEVSEGRTTVEGTTRDISFVTIEVGTTWTFTEDGEFEVPATGTYEVELHGGGGGAAIWTFSTIITNPNTGKPQAVSIPYAASGGGSGELFSIALTRGDVVPVVIGAGGTATLSSSTGATNGGASSFGTLSVDGGGRGYGPAPSSPTAGTGSGSLATSGASGPAMASSYQGGYGNSDKTSQTYGNGGSTSTTSAAYAGSNGAAIITYKGKS